MRLSENFSCRIVKLNSELLIDLEGDLDMHTVSKLQELIRGHLVPEIKSVIIDCDGIQYVDSSFLQLITRMAGQLDSVKVINASQTTRKIFKITGLSAFIEED